MSGASGPVIATVCELPDEPAELAETWAALVDHVRTHGSDLVVLPELAFTRWLPAVGEVDPARWERAVADHRTGCARLGELGTAVVVGAGPAERAGQREDRPFCWSARTGLTWLSAKARLPEEPGWHERTWFRPGARAARAVTVDGLRVGVQVCSEVWYAEGSRALGLAGVLAIAVPRATGGGPTGRWQTAFAVAALTSGAYVLSSNRRGRGRPGFGGGGCAVGPDGNVLARTSRRRPFVSVELVPDVVERARREYPCSLFAATPALGPDVVASADVVERSVTRSEA